MKLAICAVRDSKANAYAPPMFTRTRAIAERWFYEQAGNPDHDFFKSSRDYALFHLGEFDDETAVFTPLPQPVPILDAFFCKNMILAEAGVDPLANARQLQTAQ